MKKLFALLLAVMLLLSARAELSKYDLNEPMGWATCKSMTTAGDYALTGGAGGDTIVLKSSGKDDYTALKNAINGYSVIVLDGSQGDFIISQSVDVKKSNFTIVGINNARLCTKFYVTEEITKLMDDNNVKSLSGSAGTGGTLSNGVKVNEACETKVRQLLIDYTGDSKESYRQAGILTIRDKSENIIIRNLTFLGPGSIDVGGNDLISIYGSANHIWIDHCSFYDGMDGNVDITRTADFVTLSWCTFAYTKRSYNHRLTNLIAGSDDPSEGVDNLNVTFVNNIWGEGCEARMPMARFGTIHLLNNYYNCAGCGSSVNPGQDAEFRIEANYFEKGVTRIFKQDNAKSYEFWSNYYTEPFKQPSNRKSVEIPYLYAAYDVREVPAVLTSAENGAGPTLQDPLSIGRSDIVFEPKYRMVYKLNDRTYHVDYLSYGDSISLLDVPADREGYTFSGWLIDDGALPETMPQENIEINGYFYLNSYALNYHVEDALYAVDSVPYKGAISLMQAPEKEEYVFLGWMVNEKLSEDNYKVEAAGVDNEQAGIVSGGTMLSAGAVLAQTESVVMRTGAGDTYRPITLSNDGITLASVGDANLPLTSACQGATNPKDASGDQCEVNATAPAMGAFLSFDVNDNGFLYVFHKASSHKAYLASEESTLIAYDFAMYTGNAPWGNTLTYSMSADENYYVTDASKLLTPEKIVLGDAWSAAAGEDGKIGINGVAVIKFPVRKGFRYAVTACGSKITSMGFLFSNVDRDVMIGDGKNQRLLLAASYDERISAPSIMPAHDVDVYAAYALASALPTLSELEEKVDIYNLQGMLLHRQVRLKEIESALLQGVYLVDGKKMLIK